MQGKILNLLKRFLKDPWLFCHHLYRKILTNSFYKVRLRSLGRNCWIGKPLTFTAGNISMGNSVYIGPHARMEGILAYQNNTFDPLITLKDGVSIQQNLHLTCASKITIGENSAIGANVTITDINHPYTDITLPPEHQPLETTEVIIGENCKIYNNAVLLPGVFLGKHNIVGANSVVLPGIYPDFTVIAGIPGKIVKRFDTVSQKWAKTDAKGSFIDF